MNAMISLPTPKIIKRPFKTARYIKYIEVDIYIDIYLDTLFTKFVRATTI